VYVIRTVTIAANDTHATLELRLGNEAADLLARHLDEIADGSMQPVAQKHDVATSTKLIDKEDGRVRWGEEDAWRVARKLRAYTPWPGAFTEWVRGDKTTRLKLIAVIPIPDDQDSLALAPGTAAQRNCLLCVKTASGMVLVDELQPEGKTAMSSGAFLAGNKDILGAVLG
jgi:methionyl-tRNA formyltransferase